MSEDLTKKLPANESDKLTFVVTAVQDLSSRTARLDSAVDTMQVRLVSIDSRMQTLNDKVEERLYDTRPMWEQVVANVSQLDEGQQRLEQGQETARADFQEVKTFLRDILRRMSIFNDTLVTMQADYRDIYDRVRGLELKSN
jgi:predicted  nucleic acid-binding Zn-ribbon protein